MPSRKHRRLALSILPVIGLCGAVAILACRDGTSVDRPVHSSRASVADTSSKGVSSRERAVRSNHAWIGDAHNRAIDDFRKELRKPGRVASSLCDHLAAFLGEAERLPSEKRSSRLGDADGNRRIMGTVPLCAPTDGTVSDASWSGRWLNSEHVPLQSASADAFLIELQQSVYDAGDSYDLARRLDGVLSRSVVLPALEQDAIAATASVAQSSYEYWPANYAAFADEFIREYGECGSYYAAQGYTAAVALQVCVNGASVPARNLRPVTERFSLHHASAVQACGELLSPQEWREFAATDAKGAFTGFFTAVIATGGAAAFPGALLGGAGASIAHAMGKAWIAYWCIMNRPRRG
jgi:hypothetical protein